MKFEQVSEHIYSLRSWFIIYIHVWLVRDKEGLTLVDAGIGSMAKGILRAAERIDAGPINRLVLTHGHIDHVGAIGAIRKQSDVPVYAHETEIPFMEGQKPYPGRKKAQASVTPGIASPLPTGKGGELSPIGGLTPYHTPGHSPGHVVYYHDEDRVLLAGDLFTSRRGEIRRPIPMFTSDMAEAIESSVIVSTLEPDRLEVCHGLPVFSPAEQIEAYRARFAPVGPAT